MLGSFARITVAIFLALIVVVIAAFALKLLFVAALIAAVVFVIAIAARAASGRRTSRNLRRWG